MTDALFFKILPKKCIQYGFFYSMLLRAIGIGTSIQYNKQMWLWYILSQFTSQVKLILSLFGNFTKPLLTAVSRLPTGADAHHKKLPFQ